MMSNDQTEEHESLSSSSPESYSSFRRGQLVVLMETLSGPIDIERLGYLEFFAANPFLVLRDEDSKRNRAMLAGFNPRSVGYQTAPQRYANRRRRLRDDLSALVAWKYVDVLSFEKRIAYQLTEEGREGASHLSSLYADAYREAARLVASLTKGMTKREFDNRVKEWLNVDAFLIELFENEVLTMTDDQL